MLGRMTLEEKIAQIRHIHSWNVFNGQDLDMEKLGKFTGGVSWGFVEGFPLTGVNCKKNMQLIQKFMVENTRLGIPVFTVAESLHGSVHEGSTIYPQNIAMGLSLIHISEPTRLGMISYAVFCLKKKNKKQPVTYGTHSYQ